MNINGQAFIGEWYRGSLVTPVDIHTHEFSAGEPHVNFDYDTPTLAGRHFVITVRGGSFGHLGDALVYSDALRRRGAQTVSLFAPYLPAARQDRGEPFTAKVAADMINSAGFDHVFAVDPHSPVMPSLINNFTPLDMSALITGMGDIFGLDGGDVTIIAPDAGAAARAQAVADHYDLPLIQASKHRDPSKKFVIAQYRCDKPATTNAVVIDDICDGGGTFLALAKAIDMPQDSLGLWTTHGIYSRGTDGLHEHYSILASSDSLHGHGVADARVALQPILTNHLANLYAALAA